MEAKEEVPTLQVAVYVMCGGGFIGQSAAEQPVGFYIDDRCKVPYSRTAIYKAVKRLVNTAIAARIDPNDMPQMPYVRLNL